MVAAHFSGPVVTQQPATGLLKDLPGASVFVYQPGTTNQVQCYADSGLSSALSQPLTADVNGIVSFYLSYSQYVDLNVSATGVTTTTFPRVYVPDTDTADTGGQVFNVKAYGAKGDNTTDDTNAINACITAAQNSSFAGRGTIFFPTGYYQVSSAISITGSYLDVRGTGRLSSVIQLRPSVPDVSAGVLNIGTTSVVNEVRVQDLGVEAGSDQGHTTGHGIVVNGNNCSLKRVYVAHAPQDGIRVAPTANAFDMHMWDVYVNLPGRDGLYLGTNLFDSEYHLVLLAGGTSGSSLGGRYGIYNQSLEAHFYGCHPFFFGTQGFYSDVGNCQIIGGEYETNGTGGIHLITQSLESIILGASIYANVSYDILAEFCSLPVTIGAVSCKSGGGHSIYLSNLNDAAVTGCLLRGATSTAITVTQSTRASLVGLKCMQSNAAGISVEINDSSYCNISGCSVGPNPKPMEETHGSGTSPDFNTFSNNAVPGTWIYITGAHSVIIGGPSVPNIYQGNTALVPQSFLSVFNGALTHAWDEQQAIPTAPTMTTNAQANGYNVPPSVAQLAENPPQALQSQINNTASGGTLTVIPGFIYREAVTITAPITILGQGLASLRGSDDWSTGGLAGNTWTLASGVYTSSLAIPSMSTDPVEGSPTDSYSQQHREVVFSDGVGVHLVNAAPVGQQWQLNGSRNVVLGFNPAGHKIEVGTRGTVITLLGNNAFAIDGMDIRQCATSGTGQPVAINTSGVSTAQVSITNCSISWCHGGGLNFGALTNQNLLIQDTIGHDCGTAALLCSSSTGAVFRRCILFNNGLPLYGWDPGFSNGGAKVAAISEMLYDACISFANRGVGLWMDVQCTRGAWRNNVCWDNYWTGVSGFQISCEISSFAVIKNNVCFRTPNMPGGLNQNDLGIFISNSRWVDVYANLIMQCPHNFKYYWASSRSDSPPNGTTDNTHMGGVTEHGNIIIGRFNSPDQGTDDIAIHWTDDGAGALDGTYSALVTSNSGGVLPAASGGGADGDTFYWPDLINNGATFLEVNQEPRLRWQYDNSGTQSVTTISAWQSALSGRLGQNARYGLDADRCGFLLRFGLIP